MSRTGLRRWSGLLGLTSLLLLVEPSAHAAPGTGTGTETSTGTGTSNETSTSTGTGTSTTTLEGTSWDNHETHCTGGCGGCSSSPEENPGSLLLLATALLMLTPKRRAR